MSGMKHYGLKLITLVTCLSIEKFEVLNVENSTTKINIARKEKTK